MISCDLYSGAYAPEYMLRIIMSHVDEAISHDLINTITFPYKF